MVGRKKAVPVLETLPEIPAGVPFSEPQSDVPTRFEALEMLKQRPDLAEVMTSEGVVRR